MAVPDVYSVASWPTSPPCSALLPARLRVHVRGFSFYLSLVRLGRNPGEKEREGEKRRRRARGEERASAETAEEAWLVPCVRVCVCGVCACM